MRILVIAPQPFYQERGTPIATRLLIDRAMVLNETLWDYAPQYDASQDALQQITEFHWRAFGFLLQRRR